MHLIYRSLYIVVDICTRSYNYIEPNVSSHTLGSSKLMGSSKDYLLTPKVQLARKAQTLFCFVFCHPLFLLFQKNRFMTQESVIILRLDERTMENLRRSSCSLGRVGDVLFPSSSHPSSPPKRLPVAALSIWIWARQEGRERAMPLLQSLAFSSQSSLRKSKLL